MNDHGYAKNNVNGVMCLQVPPQNIPLIWQLINLKHFVSISELPRCYTIVMVNNNYMQNFRLRRKSHSLLDDPHINVFNYCLSGVK